MEFIKGVYHFILVVIMLATPTCGKAITCTSGDFAVGEVGFKVFYFPDDIDAHHSVFVQYYPSSAPTNASDETRTVSVGTPVGMIVAVHVVAAVVYFTIVDIVFRRRRQRSPERLLEIEFLEGEAGTVSVGTLVGKIVAFLVNSAVDCIITVVTLFLPRRQRSPEKLVGMEFLKGMYYFILVVITFATPTCGKAITCSAGDFAAGEVGRILCYFPDDIDSHHSVFVQYYPFSAPTDASATGVFLCKTEDVKASKCNEQDGYVLKSHTRNTLLIEVVNITEKAAGRYNCQFLPPDHSPRDMCNLTVRAKTAGETPSGEGDRDSDVLDKGNDSPTTTVPPDETGTVSVSTLVGVIVAVTVVAAIIIIVVIVFCQRRQRSPERSPVISPIQYKNSMYAGKEALDAPLMNTHSNGNKAPASGALDAPLMNTHSNGNKAPASGAMSAML